MDEIINYQQIIKEYKELAEVEIKLLKGCIANMLRDIELLTVMINCLEENAKKQRL